MSQYMKVSLPFTCEEEIDEVLKHFGLTCEKSEEGINIRGYGGMVGNRKANVVVRREQIGGSADIGFMKDKDGKWEMLVNDMDSSILTDIRNVHQFLTVQKIAQKHRKRIVLEKGEVPKTLRRGRSSANQEIVLSINL